MRTAEEAFRASVAVDARLSKASFGGDRSAAGRYAAEQRWKGHVKDEVGQVDDASLKLKEEFESPEDKIPNSPPNPKGLNARAIFNWVDGPFRRGHPRQYPINDMIRHIANGLLGLPLPRFRGIRFRKNDTYIPDEDFVNRTKNLIESIDAAEPKQPTLWRGLRGSWSRGNPEESVQHQQMLNLEVGQSFVSPIFSSSRSKGVATNLYATHLVQKGDPPSIVLKIEAGAKGLRTSVIPNDHEVLTGGKFTVTAKTEVTTTMTDYNTPYPYSEYEHKIVVISVKQTDTFGKEDYTNPNFRPDASFRKTQP
jgi:hypothetical protein